MQPDPTSGDSTPPAARVLLLAPTPRHTAVLRDALSSGPGAPIVCREADGAAAGLERLGEEVFDAVLVQHFGQRLDAADFCSAARASGCDAALVVLTESDDGDFEACCYTAGADALCRLAYTTARSLAANVLRSIDQCRVAREHRRLVEADKKRLIDEDREAERLLTEQRRIVAQLEKLHGPTEPGPLGLSLECVEGDSPRHYSGAESSEMERPYGELLQAYVVMGAGNLAGEITGLVGRLVDLGLSGGQTMELHVSVVERLVARLGARGARHVMDRADLLLVEVMMRLADGYRRRYDARAARPSHDPRPRQAA